MKKRLEEESVNEVVDIIARHRLDRPHSRNSSYKFALFFALTTILILLIFSYRSPLYLAPEPKIESSITPAAYTPEVDRSRRIILPGCAFKKIKTYSPMHNNTQTKDI